MTGATATLLLSCPDQQGLVAKMPTLFMPMVVTLFMLTTIQILVQTCF